MDTARYQCNAYTIDAGNRRLSRAGAEIVLEPRAFDVLLQLLARPGELVTRETLLDAVWGHRYVTPSTLNRIITLLRRAFGDDSEESSFIQTVRGAGYRFVGPVTRLRDERAEPRARFEPPPTARIPARMEAIIGREREIAQLSDMFAVHRAVTLIGTGGMGKTQCALEFARQVSGDYPDAVWLFDLSTLQRAGEWLAMVALALSIPLSDETEMLAKVAATFAGRRSLLVLDNCDRLAPQVGAMVFELLRATRELRVLATSQQALSFVGEQVLRISPLALPARAWDGSDDALTEIAAAPAVALLVMRARSSQPAFALKATNVAAILEICRRLDGMPLALELCAARFAVLAPVQVLERLDHRFRFLVSDATGRDRRHRTLLALLDWSFSLLSPDELRLLCWLAVFMQGMALDAVEDLAPAMGRDAETLLDLLAGLANKSLVVAEPNSVPPRYYLLETVRAFALERLAASGEEPTARDAHLAHILRLAIDSHEDMLGARMRQSITRLAPEHANIASALDWSLADERRHMTAVRIVGALMLYAKSHGEYALGAAWLERVVGRVRVPSSAERGRALLAHGVMRMHRHHHDAQITLVEAEQEAKAAGDDWGLACASGYRALDLTNRGRTQEAEPPLSAVETLATRLDDDWLHSLAGLARGWWYLARNELPDAIAELRKARDFGNDLHQRHFIGIYIGLASFGLGLDVDAAGEFHAALLIALEIGNTRGGAGSVEGCAYLCARRGWCAEAARLLGLARQVRERTALPLFASWIHHHEQALGVVRGALGAAQADALLLAGASSREEEVFNETLSLLRRIGGN
ncbi:MAG TPA: winged helix-turn-helix domain-containing protein [Steroidobacteraceae bacterium]